ncbi:MAG: phosphomannomutase [Myxococcota bacterium]
MTDNRSLALAWISDDPDPETRAAATAMLDDSAALSEHFGARLSFGTAGLRGALGPGPNRMNRAWVRRVSAGLAAHLIEAHGGGTVVVGYDARRNSTVFAEDTARVLAGAGLTVRLFDGICPTPELAHAVVFHGAVAGVMVTASHNPPQDNGYKVYADSGAQIVPPTDARIADGIPESLAAVAVPALADLRAEGRVSPPDPAAGEAWLSGALALRVHTGATIPVVYTPMHGVGRDRTVELLARAGHHDVAVVPEQGEPDGTFPTVSFPNPEEPGALDLAIAHAERVGASLIIANDPDADRLAVALPHAGRWIRLTGNEVGVLLAEDLLAHGPKDKPRMVATTIVSTSLLARIAAVHGAHYAETLTGFKWIGLEAIAFDAAGGQFVLGFEEAIGYSAGSLVRDKDGISTALLLVDLAAHLASRGQTLLDALEDLARRFGVHATRQRSVRLPGAAGAATIRAAMDALRASPPDTFDGVAVVRHRDLLEGVAVDRVADTRTPLTLPPSNVLGYELEDGRTLLVRPSGTEPKLKFYAEAREALGAGGSNAAAEVAAAAADRLLDAVSSLTGLG